MMTRRIPILEFWRNLNLYRIIDFMRRYGLLNKGKDYIGFGLRNEPIMLKSTFKMISAI